MKRAVTALLCIISLSLSANTDSLAVKYSHKLQLIDSLSTFICNDMHLDVPYWFYKKWDTTSEDMYYYVYSSTKDSIEPPYGYLQPYHTWSQADVACDRHIKSGYHSFIYKTAGRSDAKLNHRLLTYPDEAMAFIVVHEASHLSVRGGSDTKIPYVAEEALADVTANYALLKFAREKGMLDTATVLKQTMIFENIYRLINDNRKNVQGVPVGKQQAAFKFCKDSIMHLTETANIFQKDRMRYEVNNAYFVRVEPYGLHYFEIQNILGRSYDLLQITADINRISEQQKWDKDRRSPDPATQVKMQSFRADPGLVLPISGTVHPWDWE